MAPTTSTTMCMALGDALAVALMERRGLTREEYGVWHPGGRLGARVARVSKLMHSGPSVPLVSPDLPMGETLIAMSAGGFGVTGLVEEGLLVGVITDGDLRRNIEGLMERTAGQVATRNPVSVPPDMLASEALSLMNRLKISMVFVTQEGRPVGLLHVHDCLRAGVV